MNATQRLNFLLSDILRSDSGPSSRQTVPSLTFAEHDYHPSSTLPSNTTGTPLVPRRNSASMKHHRQRRHPPHSSSVEKQTLPSPPLLNSSTLDDLFRALTLECEQYLAAATTSYQNKTYGPLTIPSLSNVSNAVESNDDDYENLHSSIPCASPTSLSLLKTSIEVMSPEKRQIVSSKISSSALVPLSRTFPLLSSSSYVTSSMLPSNICHSSDDGSLDRSSPGTARRRRRRCTRKQVNVASIHRSSSSSDDRTETLTGSMTEKKCSLNKRSASSVDHRLSRIKGVYNNGVTPLTNSSSSSQKSSMKTRRRRDISLQHAPMPTQLPRFPVHLYSPLSVLLTSTRPNSDFLDRPNQQRSSRPEFVNQPQFYRSSPRHHPYPNNNKQHSGNIPMHRIPSYPVY